MKFTIELEQGNKNKVISREDFDRQIDALHRAMDDKMVASDFVLIIDCISILRGLKVQIPPDY